MVWLDKEEDQRLWFEKSDERVLVENKEKRKEVVEAVVARVSNG